MEIKTKNYIPLTRIQKLIVKRMSASKADKPCFYLEVKADVTELMAMRPRLRKSLKVKITTNAFYIRALALAAGKYPAVLGKIEDYNIKIANHINVGFAVNAPHGLVVPVVKDADRKSLSEIARLEKLLTEKTRDNELTLEEIEGETIALSNLGAYGIDSFFGIVPPPASAILAVGNVIPTIIARNDKPVVRKMVSLTLAVDHKILNPDYAAQFLNFIKEQLQKPQQLTGN